MNDIEALREYRDLVALDVIAARRARSEAHAAYEDAREYYIHEYGRLHDADLALFKAMEAHRGSEEDL